MCEGGEMGGLGEGDLLWSRRGPSCLTARRLEVEDRFEARPAEGVEGTALPEVAAAGLSVAMTVLAAGLAASVTLGDGGFIAQPAAARHLVSGRGAEAVAKTAVMGSRMGASVIADERFVL